MRKPCSAGSARPSSAGSSNQRAIRSARLPAASIPAGSRRWGWRYWEMTLPVDHVEVNVPDERFLPDVEAAAYFLCVEALTNVAKYAQATAARVLIEVANQTLAVEVGDNGVGGADPAKGTGLLGLQDRLDVLGGVLAVESSRRGTRVRGVIPLKSSEIFLTDNNQAVSSASAI